MKEKKVRNLCVKMYGDPEPKKLGIALSAIGEAIYTDTELSSIVVREGVKDNDMPIYAHYSNKREKWVLSVEAPLGEYTIVTSSQAMKYIKDNFEDEFEYNAHSKIAAISIAFGLAFCS